ncbi:MAG: cell division protein FtsA [bacterium]|nr:cell division protein FtsA [bacterium]
MSTKIIAGLDLGTTKVVCIIAKVGDNERPDVIGIGVSESTGLSRGIVTDIELSANSITTAIRDAERRSSVKLSELYTVITGEHIKSENSSAVIDVVGPNKEITSNDVDHVIKQAISRPESTETAREIIHTITHEFRIDDQPGITAPIGMIGNQLAVNVCIITGAYTAVQNIAKSVKYAGFGVRDFVLQSIASSYAVLHPDERELGCVLINIGGGTTDIAILYDGNVREIFSIGFGGIDVTHDISVGIATPLHKAEELKTKYGVACEDIATDESIKVPMIGSRGEQTINCNFLASIIEARLAEIFNLVYKRLKYSEYIDLLPAGIVLTGGTAKMRGIEKLAERILGIPTRIGIPSGINGYSDLIADPAYSTAVGLIIYGSLNKNGKEMGKIYSKNLFTKIANRVKKWLLE